MYTAEPATRHSRIHLVYIPHSMPTASCASRDLSIIHSRYTPSHPPRQLRRSKRLKHASFVRSSTAPCKVSRVVRLSWPLSIISSIAVGSTVTMKTGYRGEWDLSLHHTKSSSKDYCTAGRLYTLTRRYNSIKVTTRLRVARHKVLKHRRRNYPLSPPRPSPSDTPECACQPPRQSRFAPRAAGSRRTHGCRKSGRAWTISKREEREAGIEVGGGYLQPRATENEILSSQT